MSNAQNSRAITVVSGAAVRIFRFVTQDSTTGLFSEVGTAQSVRPDGVCAEAVSAINKTFPMVVPDSCVAKVEAGAAVAKGDSIASDNQGRAITAVSGVNNWTMGTAMDAAAGAGEIIRVLMVQDRDQA